MLQWLWEDSRNTAVKWLPLKRNNCAFPGNLSLLDGNRALHTLHAAYGTYGLQTLLNWSTKDCIAHAWMTKSAVLWTVCGQSREAEARAMQEDSFSPFVITPNSERILPPRAQPGTNCWQWYCVCSIFTSPCWVVVLHLLYKVCL